jgi:fucokinase
MQAFDVLVLTAANEAQAEGYRAQIAWRQGNGLLPATTRVMVMSDPGGRRVGSLGATLNVLAVLAQEAGSAAKAFEGRRILICHSGGDSRRTPAYAAQGKVFTPVPAVGPQGQPLALFDLILQTVSALPAPEAGHVLITSGDVLLTFDHASVDFSRPGITGVGYFGPVERGSHHGVYVPSGFGANAARTECVPVRDFLQKPSEAEARASGAVDPFGHVAVDTGLISMDPPTCAALLKVAGVDAKGRVGRGILRAVIDGDCPALDVYEEMTMAVTPRFDEARFISRFVTERGRDAEHKARMRKFYRALHGIPFHVNIVPYCEFFHIGSSRELLSGFSGLSRTAQMYRFTNGSGAAVTPSGAQEGGAFIFNSRIAVPFKAGQSLVEAVHAKACKSVTLSGRNILTGLPPEAAVPVTLGPGLGLVCLPIGKRDWAAVVYGLDDDFKTPYPSSARPCLFLNAPIERWMEQQGIPAAKLWRGDEKDGLWRARLWRVGAIDDVLSEAVAIGGAGGAPDRLGRRYSIAELIPLVNHGRLLAVRQEILRKVGLLHVADRILADDALPAAAICAEVRTEEETREVLSQLDALLAGEASGRPLLRARVLRLMAMLERSKSRADAHQAQAFAEIASAVAMKFELAHEPRPAAILQDQVVWVTTPVRIDFAGGWSDTPPVCTECGGTVLNAAVTLNGLYPVQVMAKLNTCGCIRLSSIDLGERQEIRSAAELLNHHDPHDWAALAKAALVLCGIGPGDAPAAGSSADPLARWLKVLGGGLDLTIFSSLPKGSGMGTSSVLGAAVIACLDRVLGVPYSVDRLIRMVSILEQRLCTGGGWQDQVGGVLPGVKLIRTEPGPDQTVSLRWTVFDLTEGSELQKRCLLYFTGQKRMARNILQNVVNGYLGRDPVVLRTIADLKRCAVETKEALDAQDVDGFAAGVARYWELKKRIDPGSTNEPIERLLARVKPDTQAALLPGAGGGGFIFIVAKDAAAAGRIRRAFLADPPNAHARFFDFAIDHQGLKVTVL